MKNLLLTISAGILLSANTYSQTITRLLAASPQDDTLRVLDTSNYSTVSYKNLAFSSSTLSFDGCNGLTMHPVNNTFYIVGKSSTSRYLGVLNPATGSITLAGDLGDKFSQLTVNGNNSLLGVTGDGATNPESVFRINTSNATNSLVAALGNGLDGEVICYNPVNNKVYHWSGNSTVVYEVFDTTFVSPTNITITPGYSGETFGAVYKTNAMFLINNIQGEFRHVDTLGNFSNSLSTYSVPLKGLAYITCPRVISGSSVICGGAPVTLTMSAGGTAYQWYLNGVAIANATNQAISTSTAGYYKCMISDGCGTDSTAAGKNIITASLPVVTISGGTLVCAGQSITLTGSSGGTSQWYQNGVIIPSATSNTLLVSTAGIYNMMKTNTNGCKDSAAVGKNVSVSACTGIQATAFNTSAIKIYPNPSNGKFAIESNSLIGAYEVRDLRGRMIMKDSRLNTTTITIDLSSFTNSVYIISLTSPSGETIQQKVILNK